MHRSSRKRKQKELRVKEWKITACLFIFFTLAVIFLEGFAVPFCSDNFKGYAQQIVNNPDFKLPFGYWITDKFERGFTICGWDGTCARFTYWGKFLREGGSRWVVYTALLLADLLLSNTIARVYLFFKRPRKQTPPKDYSCIEYRNY